MKKLLLTGIFGFAGVFFASAQEVKTETKTEVKESKVVTAVSNAAEKTESAVDKALKATKETGKKVADSASSKFKTAVQATGQTLTRAGNALQNKKEEKAVEVKTTETKAEPVPGKAEVEVKAEPLKAETAVKAKTKIE